MMFPLQNRCNGLVGRAGTILIQFIWLQNSPIFSVTDDLHGFIQFPFQYEVRKRSMMSLLRLTLTRFSEVSNNRFICVFHVLAKRSTIPQIESKQYALSNLRGIVNASWVLEDNGFKNDHPLRVPLTSMNPIKFYRQDSRKYLS